MALQPIVDYAKFGVRTAASSERQLALIQGRRRAAGAKASADYRSQVGGRELIVLEHLMTNALSFISPV